jgi:isopentenyl phosphate kinase
MQVIKLGGSVITDKREYRKFNRSATKKIVAEISRIDGQFILVHGAGSFGHIKAREYALHMGKRSDVENQEIGFSLVHSDVRDLNLRIMNVLRESALPAVSIPPFNAVINENGKIKRINMEHFRTALALGLVPVTFGDVVFDEKTGFSICSGDDLTLELARSFNAHRVLFLCDVDGVYDRPPNASGAKLLPEISPETIQHLGSARHADVTGSIYGKVQKCIEFLEAGNATEVWILSGKNMRNLRNALIGKPFIGTKVVIK